MAPTNVNVRWQRRSSDSCHNYVLPHKLNHRAALLGVHAWAPAARSL